jgi:hypothetical protein
MYGVRMRSATELQREIQKTRQHLSRLEARYYRVQARTGKYTERERVEQAKRELLRKYPNMTFTKKDESILRLVGTLPYVPLSKEKQEIARAIVARYE